MSISIYVLESSIVDFAGSVIAVDPEGPGVYFDAPHLHSTQDKALTLRLEQVRRVFILGVPDAGFGKALAEVRRTLKRIAVPMVSTKPLVNSDGIAIRSFIVYKSQKVDTLIPKVFSALGLPRASGARCVSRAHFAMDSLGYSFCPVDGTPFRAKPGGGLLATLLKQKRPISEVRVEEASALKTCGGHPERRFPNGFTFCPICGERLGLCKRVARATPR